MISHHQPLMSMTAGDLMTPAVVTLPQEMRLAAAARMLRSQQVSGAPVIDHEGRCVGVLSTTDFMRFAEEACRTGRLPCRTFDALGLEWEMYEPDDLSNNEIRQYMTSDPVTVSPETGIVRMAQMMLDGHIHRLIVVDAERRPIGIVSTTDLLAAIAQGDNP